MSAPRKITPSLSLAMRPVMQAMIVMSDEIDLLQPVCQ